MLSPDRPCQIRPKPTPQGRWQASLPTVAPAVESIHSFGMLPRGSHGQPPIEETTMSTSTAANPVRLRPSPWPGDEVSPGMSNIEDAHERYRLTNRRILVNGRKDGARLGRAALLPGSSRSVARQTPSDEVGRRNGRGDLRLLDPPRAAAWRDRFDGDLDVAAFLDIGGPGRPRCHPAHRPVVPRRGAQRRLSRLGAAGRPCAPHRRPRLPRAWSRLVRPARRRRSHASAAPTAG